MAKFRKVEAEGELGNGTPADILRAKLRGAGCLTLWSAHPRNSAFTITAYMTTGRRILILQEYDSGNYSVHEEISNDQVDKVIRQGS